MESERSSTPHEAPRSTALPVADSAGRRQGTPEQEPVVEALHRAAAMDGRWSRGAIAVGWAYGRAAQRAGLALYQMIKQLRRLEASALDRAAACEDARGAARAVHDAASLLDLAALEGFTAGMVDALRVERRVLRHDLRNPVGTIKNALVLLGDASPSGDTRSDKFRQMASRNAIELESMIRQRLADSRAEPAALTHAPTPLSELLLEVCESMSALARSAAVTLVVEGVTAAVQLESDALALELLLRVLVLAAIDAASPGSHISIYGQSRGRKGGLVIGIRVSDPASADSTLPLPLVGAECELARRAGARVSGGFREGELLLELGSRVLSAVHDGEDLARPDEAHDLESGLL